jgi:NAD-specific glutamate dehydrogenase
LDLDPSVATWVLDDLIRHILSVVLDWWIIEFSTNESLGSKNSVFGVGNGLSLSCCSNNLFSFLGEGDNWWCGSDSFSILDDFGSASFHEGDTWVGGTEINTNDGSLAFGEGIEVVDSSTDEPEHK